MYDVKYIKYCRKEKNMATVTKAFKYRIYPTDEQITLLSKTFGCARYVYNHFLDFKKTEYAESEKSYSAFDLINLLVPLKQETEWLKEPDSFALVNSIRDLDATFKNFFKGAGYPKFKSKHKSRNSYRTTFTNNNIKLLDKFVQLPKLGKVKIKDRTYRPKTGRILNATVSKAKTDKYFVSICYADVEIESLPKTNKKVGLDLGISKFITTSDMYEVLNPKYLETEMAKLKKLHRSLSRKPNDSKNKEKARLKLAKCYEKITNQRKDFLHKLSRILVEEYDLIVIEDLKIENLLKNHKLAQSISSASWYTFTEMLKYKSEWYSKRVVKVDTFFPSSQLCNSCGYKNKEVKNLGIREWGCPICGSHNYRDLNAAKNILNKGLEILEQELIIELIEVLKTQL